MTRSLVNSAVVLILASACAGVAVSQSVPVTTPGFGVLPPYYAYDGGVNISDASVGNIVYQTFQFYMTPPPVPKEAPPTASLGQLSVNNPTCGDGSKHYTYSLTSEDIKKSKTKHTVFIVETHEIMPVMLVTLQKGKKDGTVAVRGPGMLAEVTVDRKSLVRTVCGNWVHSNSGYYEFEMLQVKDATVRILYYTRKYNPSQDLVDFAFPIDVELDLNTFAAVDNHDIEVYVGVTADWATREIVIDVEQFVADRATYVEALDYSLTNGFSANSADANLYDNSYGVEDYDYWFDNTYGEDLDRLSVAGGV